MHCTKESSLIIIISKWCFCENTLVLLTFYHTGEEAFIRKDKYMYTVPTSKLVHVWMADVDP